MASFAMRLGQLRSCHKCRHRCSSTREVIPEIQDGGVAESVTRDNQGELWVPCMGSGPREEGSTPMPSP